MGAGAPLKWGGARPRVFFCPGCCFSPGTFSRGISRLPRDLSLALWVWVMGLDTQLVGVHSGNFPVGTWGYKPLKERTHVCEGE